MTINDTALFAADKMRKRVIRIWTHRNKWTVNSLYPKQGSKAGFIPLTKKSSKNAYVRVGTIQKYMLEQEKGWTETNAFIPTDKARVGGSFKKRIKKAASLKHIRSRGVMEASAFKRPRSKKAKIAAMISVAKRIRYKGIIQIKAGDSVKLPPGYYKVVKKSLQLWRYQMPGSKRHKATHWHTKTIKESSIRSKNGYYYVRNADKVLRGIN